MGFLETTLNVNLSTPINQLGYGIAGLNIAKALTEAGHTVALFTISNVEAPEEYHEMLRPLISNSRWPDFTAPSIRLWHQHDMSQFVGSGPKVAFPIFELDTLADIERHHLGHCDYWFVCSQWAKDVLVENLEDSLKSGDIADRTFVIPLGVDRSIFRENISQREETIFLNVGKWEVRKGHDILVEAFNLAFEEEDDVELWMLCDNPFYRDEENFEWERLYRSSKLGDKVKVIPRQDTQTDVYNIMAQSDCGVFPSRGEGWNLDLLEMMSCGKSAIATNYSAHTEFCNKENCYLVDLPEKEEANDGKWFRGQGGWGKIDTKQVEEIAEHMKNVHELKKNDNLNLNQAGIDTAKKFSWENSAKCILEAVKTMQEKDDTHTE